MVSVETIPNTVHTYRSTGGDLRDPRSCCCLDGEKPVVDDPRLLPNFAVTRLRKILVTDGVVTICVRDHIHDINDDLSLLFHARPSCAVYGQEILRDPWDLSRAILHSKSHEPKSDDVVCQGVKIVRQVFLNQMRSSGDTIRGCIGVSAEPAVA
jgi:hypothetical protein